MKVAAVQHDIVWQDGESTRARLRPLLGQAVAGGARLVVLTEMYATGFSMDVDQVAEVSGGPNEQFLIEQAAEHGVWVVGSISQRVGTEGKAANVAVLAGPAGQLHRYAKIHPFSYSGEDRYYQAGSEFLTVDIEGLRVSVFICYDLRFADEFWQLAQGTDLYLVVANWPDRRREHWQALLRARAIENQAYVIGCNRVGEGDGIDYAGDSAIIDPLGRTLVEATQVETVLSAEVDPAEVRRVRSRFPFLADRRRQPADEPV
jgi:predicted amidohydrolase